MSLLLTGSRDQALLTMVIQEASAVACDDHCPAARTTLQKLLYFLKVLRVPMNYRFDVHACIPYCEEVSRDLDWMIADEVIVDRSPDGRKHSNYVLGPAARELLLRHAQSLEPSRERIRDLVRALAPLRSERLELMASLDYHYRYKKASGGNGPWKDVVIIRFRERKRDQLPPDEITQAYDDMVVAGLVEP